MGLSPLSFGDLDQWRRSNAKTVEQFHRAVCPALSVKAAEKRLGKLREAGLIAPHPLTGNKVYYSLTQKGGRLLGMKKRIKVPGSNSVIRSITLDAYEGQAGARIMPKEETTSRFCQEFFGCAEWPSGIPATYCHTSEDGDQRFFNCLVLDLNKGIRRLHKFIEKIHWKIEQFEVAKELLATGVYRFVVLTGTDSKAATIRKLKMTHRITVVVVPELGGLLRG
jgi:hypothetical protein